MPSNASFIDVNEQLAALNVVNRWFFLDTLNPIVKDLDPYDLNLDKDDIHALDNECKQNIWYFLREVIRVKDANGNLTKYKLDLSKLASIYCSINNINNHPVGLKEQGTLQSVACLLLWEILFKKDYKKIILNDIYEYGETLYFFIVDLVELLPEYLKDRIVCDDDKRAVFANGIQKLFPSQYPINKRNIVNIVNENIDNISVYPNFENMEINTDLIRREELVNKSYTVLPSYIVANNSIHKTDINLFVKSSLKWDEIFLDLDIDALKSYLKRNSLTNFIYIEYKYEELGYTKDYMREHGLVNPDFTRLKKPDIIEAEKAREEAERLRESEINKLINMTVSAELLPPESEIEVKKTVDDDSIDLHFYIPRGKASEGFSYDDLSPEDKADLLSGTYSKDVIDSMMERLQYYGDINTIPNEVEWNIEINDDGDSVTLVEYVGFDSNIVIPYSLNGYIVTKIADNIFNELEYVNTIILPSCIKEIGSNVFASCIGMSRVTIPNGLVRIGDGAFTGINSIKNVYVPDSVTDIGIDAFNKDILIITESRNNTVDKYAKDNGLAIKYETIDIVTLDDSTPVNKTYLETRLDDALDGGEI